MNNKFNLTKEQNKKKKKKVLVSNIYNSAKLEGINTTYPDTLTILEGVNVPNLKLDEINCILNLRDAWNNTLSTIDDELNLDYICKINSFVSRNESLNWGVLRDGKVGINGVDYVPDIPSEDVINKSMNEILNSDDSITIKAISLMLFLMRSQVFWDGNKRTSMIVANKLMIENGCGIFTIKEEYINEFNKLLTDYYNTGNKDKISKFIYDNCIYGLEFGNE